MKMTEKAIQGMGKRYKISELNQVSRGTHSNTWRVLTAKEADIEQAKQLLLEFLEQLMEKRIVKQKETIGKMKKTLEEKTIVGIRISLNNKKKTVGNLPAVFFSYVFG